MATKTYERQFALELGNPLVLPSGESVVYASEIYVVGGDPVSGIRWPQECLITKLVVRKSDGDNGDVTTFTVDLFNRDIDEDTYATMGTLSRVIPQQTASIGEAVSLILTSGYTFFNVEGSVAVPDRRIYLRIGLNAVAAEDLSWDIAIGCEIATPG
jgi:hypothetical protein